MIVWMGCMGVMGEGDEGVVGGREREKSKKKKKKSLNINFL